MLITYETVAAYPVKGGRKACLNAYTIYTIYKGFCAYWSVLDKTSLQYKYIYLVATLTGLTGIPVIAISVMFCLSIITR